MLNTYLPSQSFKISRNVEPSFLIADDHPLYVQALTQLIVRKMPEARVHRCGSIDECVAKLSEIEDVSPVLLDLSMPGMRGIEGLARVREASGGAPVTIISGETDPDRIGEVLKAGTRGFINKSMDPEQMWMAMGLVLSGGVYIPLSALDATRGNREVDGLGLTPRQRGICQYLVDGKRNKEIARLMGISEPTVKLHVRTTLRKLGATNRVQGAIEIVRLRPAGITLPSRLPDIIEE